MILKGNTNSEDHWISVSDLMAGLMMIFLFIAISYMIQVKKIAKTYTKVQAEIYLALHNEFRDDLKKWGASINDRDLSISFKEPDVLFKKGQSEINKKFKMILDDFFPRYINVLKNEAFRSEISEIRIEGHTSSEGLRNQSEDQAYFYNMKLSQDRTRSVLTYVLLLGDIKYDKPWIKRLLTANGLASSKVITNGKNYENRILSRRVEFRIRTNAEKHIRAISQSSS